MNWLKDNTPENSVIASWWDYGYWITTLSERTTLADNATLIDWQIKKIAYSLITTPENSWHILNSHYSQDISEYLGNDNIEEWGGEKYESWLAQDISNKDCQPISATDSKNSGIPRKTCFPLSTGLDADYILIFLAGERIDIPDSDLFLYTLEGGADESKKHWFIKISNHDPEPFLESDGVTPTDYFMENSALGKLIPYSIYTYVEPTTNRASDQYFHGSVPVYYKDVKFVDSENDPFYLVYASPSFYNDNPGPMITVLIYKINPNYNP
jgi:dolichyl-diphosphooligosaccharide--protein glycosyltransferase